MDLKSILNLTLLALSLSTVLITVVSFILFKIKQISIRKLYKDPNRLDGVFFVRFAPHLDIVNLKARELYKIASAKKSKTPVKSVVVLFFIIVTIIISVLVSEAYIGDMVERRKNLSQVENYKTLIEKGLLRKLDFVPTYKKTDLKEITSESTKKNITYLTHELLNKKIIILDDGGENNNQKNKGFNLPSSTSNWEVVLQQFKIPYSFQKIENIPDDVQLIIIDNKMNFKTSDLLKLETLINKGVSLLASRNLGVEKNSDKPELNQFITKYFGLSFANCNRSDSHPTLFAADKAPFWNINGGYLVNWKSQTAQCAYSTDPNVISSGFEGSFEGDIKKVSESNQSSIVRLAFKKHEKSKVGWMAFEPMLSDAEEDEKTTADIKANAFALSTLAWMTEIPTIKISSLPLGVPQPLILSFEYGGEQKYLDRALTEFMEANNPFSFFIENEKLSMIKESLKGNDLSKIDFSAYFKVKNARKVDSQIIDKEYFNAMQENRINLEEESSAPVVGIKVDPDFYTESVLYTALENKFKYILGGNYELSNKNFSYLDRFFMFFQPSTLNKFDTRINKQIVNSENFKKLFDKLKNESELLGLPYMYHSNNLNINNLDNLKYVLHEINNKKFKVFNYKQMIDWFELRQNILIDISNTGNDVYSIYIKNNNESKVDDIHIVTSKNILDSESNTPFPEGVKKLESNKINIKSLAPAEEMTLKIRF